MMTTIIVKMKRKMIVITLRMGDDDGDKIFHGIKTFFVQNQNFAMGNTKSRYGKMGNSELVMGKTGRSHVGMQHMTCNMHMLNSLLVMASLCLWRNKSLISTRN